MSAVFGKYEIVRRLAIGGMGEIFLAEQTGVGGFSRPAILKGLRPELAEEERNVRAFIDEAQIAATLNHPNIVSIYEVGRHSGEYYIAMEYIEGDSVVRLLRGALKKGERLSPRVIAQIVRDAAAGLHFAHTATDPQGRPLDLIHRDVSPHNLVVRTDGVTKVVDFGIAKAANRIAETTGMGIIKGKVGYMSPESLHGGAIDPRTDQFALGIVSWELAAGRRYLESADDPMEGFRFMAKPVPSLSDTNTEVPALLIEVVDRMVQPDPQARYPNLGEVVALLEQFIGPPAHQEVAELVERVSGERIRARLTTPDRPPKTQDYHVSLGGAGPTAPMPGRGSPWAWWVAGATLVGIGLGGGAYFGAQFLTSDRSQQVVIEPPPPPPPVPAAEPPPPEPRPAEAAVKEETAPTKQRRRKRRKAPRVRKAPAQKAPGFLTLKTVPNTRVSIDGGPFRTTPLFKVQLSPGVHEVRAVDEGSGIDVRFDVRVEPGRVSKINKSLR